MPKQFRHRRISNKIKHTVLFPKFFTRQFKYAVLPSNAVTFLDAIRSKYGPVRGVGLGPSRAAPDRIALSTEPGDPGDAVAEAFVGEPLPSSRCADDTAEEKVKFSFDDTGFLSLGYGLYLVDILEDKTLWIINELLK